MLTKAKEKCYGHSSKFLLEVSCFNEKIVHSCRSKKYKYSKSLSLHIHFSVVGETSKYTIKLSFVLRPIFPNIIKDNFSL